VHRDRRGGERLLRNLGSTAGNRAVALALQRQPGWPDASKEAPSWNDAKPKPVGHIWRLAVAGLPGGTDKDFTGPDSGHTTESAAHRAIVLVPDHYVAESNAPVEVLLYFHGHTEMSRGRYAGWRQRSFKEAKAKAKAKGKGKGKGKGKAAPPSDNTVRDVALDQIEDQIEASGHDRMIGILPQGGEQSQFGESFDADRYVQDTLAKTSKDYPKQLAKPPTNPRLIVSGHSGGGRTVRDIVSGTARPANLTGIILFDAESMAGVITARLGEDMTYLTDPAHTEEAKWNYLGRRPVVRVFARKNSKYGNLYRPVFENSFKNSVATWQATLKKNKVPRAERAKRLESLTHFLPGLMRLYTLDLIDPEAVEHEEIIRGVKTDSSPYVKGRGNLEKGLRKVERPPEPVVPSP
jgi:hypothetical protein